MDILIINSLIVFNSLNSVMINYELFRRNFDSERLLYAITELLLLLLLRQLLLLRAYGLRILSCSLLLRRRRGCCVLVIILSLPDSALELISIIIMTTKTIGAQGS